MEKYIISIEKPSDSFLRMHSNLHHFAAITTVNLSTLPLYTQYMMDNGRHFHMEISNKAMVGCFLSHVEIWKMVKNESLIVLEEDAVLETEFDFHVELVINSVNDVEWDVIMLAARMWQVSTGKKERLNQYLYQCKERKHCDWYGTRGYILHPRGARKLLENMPPMVIQVDAYMSLMNSYHPNFLLLWTKEELVHGTYWRFSTIWDNCLVCFVKEGMVWWVGFMAICVVGWSFGHFLKVSSKT